MASEEPARSDPGVAPAAAYERRPWQFSLRALMLVTAAAALFLSAARILGEATFVTGILFLIAITSILAYTNSSNIAGMLAWLMLIQVFGGAFLAPGDCGVWLCKMLRLYFGADVYLFARLCVFYQIAQRHEPRLSWFMKTVILTSPIWMAVVATYLMDQYHLFG